MSFPNVKVNGYRGFGTTLPFNGNQTYNTTPYQRYRMNMGSSLEVGNYQNNPILLSQTHYWPRWYKDPFTGECKPMLFNQNYDPNMTTYANLIYCMNDNYYVNPILHYQNKPKSFFKGKIYPSDYKDLYGNENMNLWIP